MLYRRIAIGAFVCFSVGTGLVRAADMVTLSPATWDAYVPAGKEVDCIYGDLVLRNDRLVAVIAAPLATRNANMTVQKVGGCVIDLTVLDPQSDQLSAYYPGGKAMAWRAKEPLPDVRSVAEVQARFQAETTAGQPQAELIYTLRDGEPFLLVETLLTNSGDKPLDVSPVDEVRADGTFEKVSENATPFYWAYDPWFGQAYGVVADEGSIRSTSDAKLSTLQFASSEKGTITIGPGETKRIVRRLFPGSNLLQVRGIAHDLAKVGQESYSLLVRDGAGAPVADAVVRVTRAGVDAGSGRTDGKGRLDFRLPSGAASAEVQSLGRGTQKLELKPGTQTVDLPVAGWVEARITDATGGPIPCKVQFRGQGATPDPYFAPQTAEHAVHNLYYSHDGTFTQVLPPGKYEAIVSHGPEFDAVYAALEIRQGAATPLTAKLTRALRTDGWISADFHNHASPSGDNTSSQYGRVLNLLCEHVEYAPCTEHNRVTTYEPHLTRLNATRLMGTCTGIELTGSPLPLNHQNAFPLLYTPRTQDGGGPTPDAEPELQIARLALWDNRSDKLVQQNHPDLGQLFFDKNGDGKPDGGFTASLPYMDVIEVHPLDTIFQPPKIKVKNETRNNTVLNWLQLLNQGRRIPGVVNTDAHYNFHGSGFLRIYLRSPTDDPSAIKTLDVVHAAEQGHVLMTTGPFLEVTAKNDEAGVAAAGAGDDLVASSGKVALHVRVQCANWYDIDRVQVLLNGRMPEELNFTRASHPDRFATGTVKFDQTVPLDLKSDTHVIVVAAGQHLTMGPVMGPEHGKDMPIAMTNPIFVDVDGGGFKANGDPLDVALPVAAGK